MVTIRTVTWVDAPVERCFRLAISVDFQLASSRYKDVEAITSGQSNSLEQGDTVTWRGRMFGLGRTHTHYVEVVRPFSYIHETMVDGSFMFYEQERHFAAMDDGTRMRNEVRFSVGWGPLGRQIEKTLLKRRVAALLKWRNEALKEAAESEVWKRFVEGMPEVPTGTPSARGKRPNSNVDTKSHFFAH
jgi:ligand-binding SRPBCC domain-containing protein